MSNDTKNKNKNIFKNNMTMKKILMTMVALLSMTVVMAQDSDKKERRAPKQMTAEQMTERMTKDLTLNDDQKTKVLALNKKYKDVLGGQRMGGPRGKRPDANTGATEGQRPERPQMTDEQKAQMKKNMEQRKAYDNELKSILSADQYKKYQSQHKRGRRGGPRGGQAPKE